MPPKDKKDSKSAHWKSKDAEWSDGTDLWIKNEDLAEKVFRRAQIDKDLRLLLEDELVTGTGTCNGTWTPYGATPDFEWDDAGCLKINDADLIELVRASKAAATFKIVVSKTVASAVLGTPPPATGHGIGEQKVNAQCTC